MNSDFSKLSKEERELRLTSLALGELAPAEAGEIHQAIAADAELAREFERLNQTVKLVRETSAMDRRISPEGTPLRLDDTRRQKLLEAFKTPAPRAAKPRRRRKLWFVPMSAAAAVIGLLIAAMAFPHMRGERRRESTTVFLTESSDGVFAGESVSKRLLARLFAQPSAQADLEGRPQDTVALADLAAEMPAPNPEPLARGTKSLAIALPTADDKDGDGFADLGWRYAGRDDFGTTRKPAEALNEFSVLSDSAVGRKLEVKRETAGLAGGAVRGQEFHIDVDSAGRVYLGSEDKAEGIAGNTRSPQHTPPANSITVDEVMYNPIPETAPVLAQAAGMNNSSVTVHFSETKDRVAALQPEKNAPVASRPFGEPTWIGVLDRPWGGTAAATQPPANAAEQAGATVYSVNAAGYANLALKASGAAIPNTSASGSVEAFKAGDAVVNFAKEAKPASDVSFQWKINSLDGQESGLARPNAQSLVVTAPTRPDSQPPLENSASAGMWGGYRRPTEPDAGRLALDNNGRGDAIRTVPIFKIQPGHTIANETTEFYTSLDKTPHDESIAPLAITATDPNRFEAAKFVQDGKLFYESKQLLTEVEQAWSAPVARFQVSGQAGAGPAPGGGGATPYAQDSIAPSGGAGGRRGGANRISGISGGGFFGGSAGQPAKPEIQIANGDIDALSDELAAIPPQRLAVDAKFMDVKQDDRRALGGNVASSKQILDQDRAVRSANLATIYHDAFMNDGAVVPSRSDDGIVVYQNGAEVGLTNALVSNNSWPGASTTNYFFSINDSSWFGKDVREKSRMDGYAYSFGDQQDSKGQKPVSVDFAVSGSLVAPGDLANNDTLSSVTLAEDTGSSLAGFPATAGGQTFGAGLGSGVAPQGLANGRAYGVAQSQPAGGGGAGGFGRSGFGNRLNSAVRRSGSAAGGADATTRGFYQFGAASTDAGAQTRGVEIQLPAQANEEASKTQSSPARPGNERTATGLFAPRHLVSESLLGVDAAGLPIADVEAKEKKLDKVNLNYGGIVIEDKLEKKNAAASPVETGKPVSSRSTFGGVPSLLTMTGATAPVTDAEVAAQVAVRMTAPEVKAKERQMQLVIPQSFARTNISSNGQVSARITDHEKADDPPRQIVDQVRAKPALAAPTPQPEVLARENEFSTFSLNVSDVSFKLAAASLEKGAMPEVANIRSEEFINAFDYRDPMPAPGAPLAFAWERARYPFAHNRDVVRFAVKTAAQGREAGKPLNIVLLLDNSGSMERADRVQIIQEALRTLAAQLKPQDKLSVVTFSRTARLWADGVSGAQAAEVANKIGALTPEGGTNLEDALDLAYKTALRHYLATAVNRVVLLTDGAANLGNVEPKELKTKVEGFRKQGIALDCFGIGWEGFNDDLLEQLSRNGDGRYGFVNTPEEATSEFVGQLAGALRVAASDVKMQVEFNPKRVTAWRQIGYAKHQLTKQQFRDNKVDAAEIGAAESGNALYVIETNPNGEGPIATVRARFRVPQTSDYREHEWVVPFGSAVELEQSSPSLRLAASASAFSEWLASSPFAGDVSTDRLLKIVSGVPEIYGADPRPKKLEWMIRQAKSISGK